MTLDELVDMMARQPGGSLRLTIEQDRERSSLVLTLVVATDPGPGCLKGPVRKSAEVDLRLAGAGVSRHLRQIAGEAGHAARAELERPYSALVEACHAIGKGYSYCVACGAGRTRQEHAAGCPRASAP